MKKFTVTFLLIALLALFLTPFASIGKETAFAEDERTVYHLFTHALIAYPEIAFDKKNPMREHYNRDCLTVGEFEKILDSLYRKGFILVSPEDVFEIREGKAYKKYPDVGDKKPLLFSFDDINYYTAKMNLGMNDRLIADAFGNVATYTENAKEKISYDNEVVTVLENFVEKNQDFSYKGAKGIICLTGFDGILGYRTNSDSPSRESETAKAKVVVERLKAKNWRFACHSYGHYHMKKQSEEAFKRDIVKWKTEVEPIVGKTPIYVYPYGEWEMTVGGEPSRKQAFLAEVGFSFFWGVGSRPFYGYLPFGRETAVKYLFMDRTPLDGFTLKNNDLSLYFDNSAVFDRNFQE